MNSRILHNAKLRKLNKATLNFWFALVLMVIIVATVITAFTNIQLHTWLGIGMVVAVVIHIKMHDDLIIAIVKKLWQRKLKFRWKWLLDIGLLVSFVPLVFSGLIVSYIYAPRLANIHELSAYTFSGLIALHIFLSRKWLISKLRHVAKRLNH